MRTGLVAALARRGGGAGQSRSQDHCDFDVARAVRAEQAEHFARMNVEVDSLDGCERSVVLGEASNVDGRSSQAFVPDARGFGIVAVRI